MWQPGTAFQKSTCAANSRTGLSTNDASPKSTASCRHPRIQALRHAAAAAGHTA
eukprot:CAMPEP_0204426196 /NCGR_PEP_ID=MMETSP0470-20130426/51579_1 /ASSEMBLY_ACC=CAM_ASM_000385 /TAXON_ID=2969 /ORGANISM="Oxyrrhis marina" /LENGTH=53 /DNA_ID=CAMNT_0051423883 /DNA_START=19 /DNA_END=177 /DNA_ORIENTATION=+